MKSAQKRARSPSAQLAQATATCLKNNPQQYTQQLEHDPVRDSARRYDEPINPPRESVGPHGRLYIADYAHKKEYRIRIMDEGRVKTVARIPTDGVIRK